MSTSRQSVLEAHLTSSRDALRPILTSLNGDTAWLMSFPRPAEERASSDKAYFHIVMDPWLVGDTHFISPWFITISAERPPAIPDGAAVESVVQEIEAAASTAGVIKSARHTSDRPGVDTILLSLHLLDHLHEPTLRTFGKRIPVVATPEAASIINAWGYFDSITTTGNLESTAAETWSSLHPGGPLPPWLSVFRLVGHQLLNFACVIIWTSGTGSENPKHEAIVYSPHGIRQEDPSARAFSNLCRDETKNISVLAILHGLKESFTAGSRNTLGVSAGVAMNRALHPRYWVKSHDAAVKYTGLVGLFTREYARTIMDGLSALTKGQDGKDTETEAEEDKRPNFVEVENGGCFVLK